MKARKKASKGELVLQFKEFNPELFKAYINKFSKEDQEKMFSLFCDILNMGEITQEELDDLEIKLLNYPG